MNRQLHGDTGDVIEHLVPGEPQTLTKLHHAAIMGIVDGRVVHFLDINITDDIATHIQVRTVGNHVAEPAGEIRREKCVLHRKDLGSLSA